MKHISALIAAILITLTAAAQRPSPVKGIFPEGTVFHENIPYAQDTVQKHLLDIYLPKNAKPNLPLVVWVHGGAWMMNDKYADMGYMRQTVKGFLENGYAFASIDYRHTTTKPFPAQAQDCNQALQWLYDHAAQYGFNKQKIALVGFSAGGHLASLIALAANNNVKDFYVDEKPATYKLSAVVDFYGPADLIAMASDTLKNTKTEPMTILLGAAVVDRPDLAKHASPVTYIDKNDPPFLIIHGEKDDAVPNTQSRMLNSWLRLSGVPSSVIIVPGAPHYGEMFDSEILRKEIFTFLAARLK
jgi:acetyl esterase/lipase